MDRFSFYRNIDRYKTSHNDSLEHAGIKQSVKNLATGLNNMKNYGYYNKIDNFYGPGKSRYFYSKDEWDAYQNEKNKMYDKAKAEVKARNEANEAARPKNKVEQAQYARQQEEKKGQKAVQKEQRAAVVEKTHNSVKAVDSILDNINVYCKSKETKHKIEELRKKYDLKAAGYGNGPYGYMQDEEYRKLMDPYVKGTKNILSSENVNSDNDFNRMKQIEHEWSQKYYTDLMNDVKDIIHNDDNAEWLMHKIMRSPRVMNAMSNNQEVYDVITKALKELNVSTAGFKPAEVKPIEVKPIEVKKINVK